MLSRSQQKILRKLTSRKHRHQLQMFVGEGRKLVTELLAEGVEAEFLLSTAESAFADRSTVISQEELAEWSSLQVADEVLGVFRFPELKVQTSDRVLVLDELRDPGNLGTIIRTADWFGVQQIYCSLGTVDAYNPKTVQSTMGSIGRVQVRYEDREKIQAELNSMGFELYYADMEGSDFREVKKTSKMALVMGSESHGPSDFWHAIAKPLTIPRAAGSRVESLNVASAAAILLADWASLG